MSQAKIDGFLKQLKPSKDKKQQLNFECEVQQEGIKVVPYRNSKCLNLECVYSKEELLTIFTEQANLVGNFRFECKTCSSQIYLNAFVLDSTLQKAIDDAYSKNPKSNTKIIVDKKAEWQPVPDKTRNQLSLVDLPEDENEDFVVPDIQDFTIEDYNQLLEKYKNEWPADFSETAFDAYEMKLNFQDVYNIVFKSTATINTMKFIMAYLQNQNLKDKYKWKMFYIGLDVKSFDEVKNQGVFEYIEGFEQTLGSGNFNAWEYISIFFRFEGIWSLLIYKQRDKQVVGMNYYHLDQMQKLSKYILTKTLNIKSEPKFIPAFEIDEDKDFKLSANLIFLFFYNLLVEKDFSHMTDVTKEGVNTFKSETASLKWLILKTTERYLEKKGYKKEPSVQKEPTEPSIQQQPSFREEPSFHKEPTQQQIPTQKSIPKSIQLDVKSQSTIRKDSTQQKIPSLQYVSDQRIPSLTYTQNKPQKNIIRPYENIRYVPIEKNKDDDQVIQLSRDELVNLLEKVRQNVLYEIKNPQKDLARQYVEDLDKFNVRLDRIDPNMPGSMRNQSILMTGQEMYNILDKFKQDVEHRVGEDRKHDEYNHRFHNQLLEKMGLNEQFSVKKMQQQLLQQQMKDKKQQNFPDTNVSPKFNLNQNNSNSNARGSLYNSGNINNSLGNLNNSNSNARGSIFNNSNTNARGSIFNNSLGNLNNSNTNARGSIFNNSLGRNSIQNTADQRDSLYRNSIQSNQPSFNRNSVLFNNMNINNNNMSNNNINLNQSRESNKSKLTSNSFLNQSQNILSNRNQLNQNGF